MIKNTPPQLLVWWLIWAAFQTGIILIHTVVSSQAPPATPTTPHAFAWMAATIPFLASSLIRWGVLPRLRNVSLAFPYFIIGLALAELVCFLGLFLFPNRRQELFGLSLVGILQFAPYFASRYLSGQTTSNETV